jgi:GTP-binding protein EngB required for normal cell division
MATASRVQTAAKTLAGNAASTKRESPARDAAANNVPVIAIMGHPNAGKSSVVATLTENDRIAIDKRAGTTTTTDEYPVIIDGKTVMVFVDTPGFQNPSDILEWFQAHADESDLAGAFVADHGDDPMFSHDCALLRPVAEGAGIILVVDGSKRIKEKDRTEMELLRLTGRPRMAILNNLTTIDKHMPAWQDALNKSFNSVREFNAHRATYAERVALLGALKTIDQRWEPMLDETIRAFREDWSRRIEQSADIIMQLMKDALGKRVTRVVKSSDIKSDDQRDAIQQQLTLALQQALRQLEMDAQQAIRRHFRHNVWDLPGTSLLSKDLFSEEVEQALGLKQRQLAMAGAAAGAVSGGAIDLGLGGLSFGTGALIGGVVGGALGVLGGAALAKLDIQRTLGVERFSMGPVTNPRFPFVLLDRIILYAARAMNWSHGRQAADEAATNRVPDKELRRKRGFTEALSSEDHRTLARFFAAARRGKETPHEEHSRAIVVGLLQGLSVSDVDERLAL